ncbi:GntR family transcriptional regulator [Virgibacillus sp. 179-BFC.A HS]|uniref:GntR family transcriptional regulator n=1 Tax=Tigheibacillus jepli TaxID=3035914 RepID=A0ABU5CHJ2_9BACI|nr:GntR family transcriptional regulator [Virgibacillus sp. 179-BFC.A HS]MDY0405827.1 GntR family transcriptional regulator [Virgibacillus sp. 179-BFC.A HS]
MSIKTDSRHLYLQVIDKIKEDINNGEYAEGEKLPSEFQLSKELGVSRATLREALRVLEEENVIIRRHGVGTFVNPKPVFSSGIEILSSVTSMIEESGKKAASQFLSTEIMEATAEDKKNFAPKKVSHLISVERVRTADSEPVVFCIDKIPEGIVPLSLIPRTDSLFDLLEKHLKKKVSYAISYIEPISYHDRIYDILHCSADQALLLLNQMHYTEDDEPVLYSSNYFRSDMFRFHVLRKRV